LFKNLQQCFCFDTRCSAHFPPDEAEVPCMVNILGATLCFRHKFGFLGCFKRFSELGGILG
jgi:hypothetical protein